jgi:hypothetical protein
MDELMAQVMYQLRSLGLKARPCGLRSGFEVEDHFLRYDRVRHGRPTTITFMDDRTLPCNEHGEWEPSAVVDFVLGCLPERAEEQSIRDWRHEVLARAKEPRGEYSTTVWYEHDARIKIGASAEGIEVKFTTKDSETLDFVLKLLKDLPL